MRSWRLRMTYLVCADADGEIAFLCVQGLGFGRARVGIVREGPAWLRRMDATATEVCLGALAARLRELGFVVVCFAHRDGALLEGLERTGPSTREVLIPFTVDDRETLLVPLADSDDTLLASFAPVARRDIRRALTAGYTLEESAAPRSLAHAWAVWKKELGRRNVFHRSRSTYARLLRQSGEGGFARLFLAAHAGRTVQAILVVFAGEEAAYVLGALDRDALGDLPSPSCLLHWRAMQAARAAGAAVYDLGSRSGPVHRFKSKFRPREVVKAPPVSLVLDPELFPLCRWLLPRLR